MAGAVYITSDDNSPNGTPDGAPQADAGQKTLDFLAAIKNAPAANDNKGVPPATAPAPEPEKPADPGAATLQFLQGVKDGTLPPPKKPYETSPMSLATNTAAGFNEALADTLGAPVDLANYAMRHPLEIAQKLTPAGQIQPFLDLVGGPKIVPELHTPELPGANVAPIGGSESIKQGMGLIGANPDTLAPQNGAERIARGLGSGVASALAPEAAVGGLTRMGAAVPKFVQAAIGNGATTAATASNAAIGGVAGATGETAAEFTPDDIAGAKPFIRAVGNLAGGGVAAVTREAPGLIGAGVKAGQDFVAPMNPQGQQRLAEEMIAKGASDRQAALAQLQNGPTTGVGGVPLTTYQATGDTGLGAMDRAAETQEGGVGPFNARRAAQNEARVGVIKALQPTGDPAAVAGHIRDQLADIDQMTAGIQRQATVAAQGKAAPIGTGTPEGHGAAMREGLVQNEMGAKAWEKALWQAVDPDGKLAMGAAPITTAARRLESTIPQAAKGMDGEEAAIFKAAKDLDSISKFSEITALRSRISDEMRVQRGQNGNATVLARLTQLRGVVEKAISESAEQKAAQEVEAVKSGAMKPEETMDAKLQAQADAFKRAKLEAARANTGENPSGNAGIGSSTVSGADRTEVSSGGRPGNNAGDQGVSSAEPPNLDENAAARIKAASAATKERAQTFKQGAVGETLAEQGAKGNFRILDSAVGPKFFKPGVSGAEAVSSFKTAVGNDAEAMQALENFAGLSLRKAAMNPDGTLDPDKFATWQKAHSDALRAMPEVAAKFADAAKAGEAVADATAMRSAALDGYQKTALSKFLGLSDSGDVTKTVGAIFGQKDAISTMRQIASEVSSNPDAREGLRKAVADYMSSKFIGNTEQVKSDTFQTFVRQNKPVLAQVFSHDEIKGIEAVAAELSRVKRLADLQALPGRSTTAQDLIKPIKEAAGDHGLSPFAETMVGAVEGFHAMGPMGAVGGAAAAAAKQRIMGARAAGMQNVQKLVRGMLLNPELARAALERAPTVKPITRDIKFAQQLNRVAAIAASRQISQKQDARR